MIRKIDDFLIDKVFQKIADLTYSHFGVSGISLYVKLLPLLVFGLTLVFFLHKLFILASFSIIFGYRFCRIEKKIRKDLEEKLIDGARNPNRVDPLYFSIRLITVFFVAFFLFLANIYVAEVDLLTHLFTTSVQLAVVYFLACDINPPKKKKSFKLALEPQ